MIIEKIYFDTEDGLELFGLLHKPEKESKEIIIAIHGMSSSCLKQRDDILAQNFTKQGIAYFCFNNRGTEYVTKFKRKQGDKEDRYIGGCTYEDIYESHLDIQGAIKIMKEYGYTKIHLQGHSLGCTKIVYTFNKLKKDKILEDIHSVIFLSMVDIVGTQKIYLKENFEKSLKQANMLKEEGKELALINPNYFIHPISVKTYLRYFQDNRINKYSKVW